MKIHILKEFEEFVPQKFTENPIQYYQERGTPFRTGEILIDEAGVVQDDPTAVRFFPVWKNDVLSLHVVAKKINLKKAKQIETKDPLYEWKILEKVCELNLPCAKPVGWIEQEGEYIILTERIEGDHFEKFKDLDQSIVSKFHLAMDELKEKYEKHGIERNWYLKDMVVTYDNKTGEVLEIVPTDWERTKIIKN